MSLRDRRKKAEKLRRRVERNDLALRGWVPIKNVDHGCGLYRHADGQAVVRYPYGDSWQYATFISSHPSGLAPTVECQWCEISWKELGQLRDYARQRGLL